MEQSEALIVIIAMGNQASKTASEGDVKFMQNFTPGNTKYLECWHKKYEFEGKLVEGKCKMLVDKLTVNAVCAKGKDRERKELQMAAAKLWLEQAQKRKEAGRVKRAALQVAALKQDYETCSSLSAGRERE